MNACISIEEERAITTYLRQVENTPFALTKAYAVDKANYLRQLRGASPISSS
jgi:hypothetical protein